MHITLSHVTKTFGGVRALDNVDLQIPAGQIIAVLGENGAGKSTLLRLLATLLATDKGSITIDGMPLDRERIDQRRRILFTPDTPLLFPAETILRNVARFAAIYEKETTGREEALAKLIEQLGIGDHCLEPVANLSRGQLWKAALVCVAAVEPELWLVDEPFASGMDVIGMNAFQTLARGFAAKNQSIVYTTQLVEVAAKFADYICVLKHGKVLLWESSAVVRQMIDKAGDDGESILRGLQ